VVQLGLARRSGGAHIDLMSDRKRRSPLQGAMDSVSKGFGQVLRVADSATRELRKEIETGGVAKALEDSGREIVRAATNVATHVGTGLQAWGQRTQETLDRAVRPDAPSAPEGAAASDWPASREEFERRFGKVAGDWPRSPEEFERRYGFPPGQKKVGPTPEDPGFRIASDDDRK
jgi:hypothetical protein